MPRKLKTYQTSQGFFDLAIAASSMKAALEAWGTSRNLFHQGFAKESDDSEVIAATMAKPGVVLQRPVGSNKRFQKVGEVLYQGIAARTFERSFQLADYVQVKGASLENGLLHVDLAREIPEAMQPRAIPIMSARKVLEGMPLQLAA